MAAQAVGPAQNWQCAQSRAQVHAMYHSTMTHHATNCMAESGDELMFSLLSVRPHWIEV